MLKLKRRFGFLQLDCPLLFVFAFIRFLLSQTNYAGDIFLQTLQLCVGLKDSNFTLDYYIVTVNSIGIFIYPLACSNIS